MTASLHARLAAALALAAAACVAGDDRPSWEQYRDQHRLAHGADAFVVEEDMIVDEVTLRAYYDARWPSDDGDRLGTHRDELLVNTAFGPPDLRGGPFIDYCFVDGWGEVNGNLIDGYYRAPDLAAVMPAIQQAMMMWNGAADLHFRHRAEFDGPACDHWLRTWGHVEFEVAHWGAASAQAAFPSAPNEFQLLKVPPGGINVALALHELGHILGFRHEHERPEAGPLYCDSPAPSAPLTAFDPLSVMMYRNCNVNQVIVGTPALTRLDHEGARAAYGDPDWWTTAPWDP